MQSVPAHLFNKVRDADSLQVPHRGQTTQVSPLLQDIRQRLLLVPAPAHPPGDKTLPLLLLRELIPSAVTSAAAHQVGPAANTKQEKLLWGKEIATVLLKYDSQWSQINRIYSKSCFFFFFFCCREFV